MQRWCLEWSGQTKYLKNAAARASREIRQARVNNPRVARTIEGTAPRMGVPTTDGNGTADLPLTTKTDDTCQRAIRRGSVNPDSPLALLPIRMIDNCGLSSLGNGTVALSRESPLELYLEFATTRMSLFGLQYKRKIKMREKCLSSILFPLPSQYNGPASFNGRHVRGSPIATSRLHLNHILFSQPRCYFRRCCCCCSVS